MHRRALAALSFASLLPFALVYACSDDASLKGADLADASQTPSGLDGATTFDASTSVDSSTTDGAVPDAATCSIDIEATVTAEIKMTADDYLRLWVNGVLVDDKTTTWQTVDTKTITLFRNPNRKNLIAVEVRNAYNAGGYDRGLLVAASFDAGADAAAPSIVTDPSWKIIGTATDGGLPGSGLPDGGTNVAAWFDPSFDDSTWQAPVDEGPHGMSPWGAVLGESSARWLWSYDSSQNDDKPLEDYVYFRKTFYLDMAGNPSATPPGCQ